MLDDIVGKRVLETGVGLQGTVKFVSKLFVLVMRRVVRMRRELEFESVDVFLAPTQ